MNWVTWQNVGVDRIACAWLIRRWIDPDARFCFIREDEPLNDALGEAFDIPGARLSHRQGHATFQTMLNEYRIENPALHRIARIIDEADTVQEALLEPMAAGLDQLARGVRLICRDDHEAIDKGQVLFEALYAVINADLETEESA
jgi:hypothetical protein